MWTHFWDMHSGGGTKEEPYEHIFIEAPEDEAEVIFYNRFGHNPHRITCTCCGSDYAIDEYKTLKEATAYHRKRGGKTITVKEYSKERNVLIIRVNEIKAEERKGCLPTQGYVWVD